MECVLVFAAGYGREQKIKTREEIVFKVLLSGISSWDEGREDGKHCSDPEASETNPI